MTTTEIQQLEYSIATFIGGLDTFYMLFASALVSFMQCGSAVLCAGCVRQKNCKNILLKSLLHPIAGAMGFYLIGFGIAYSHEDDIPGKRFMGTSSNFVLAAAVEHYEDHGKTLISFFFQWAFAATATTVVAGAIAERCKMEAYLCYGIFLTGFVYPVVACWLWSAHGYLSPFVEDPFLGTGVVDFAGSGVVHITGGTAALIAIKILGPRVGRFYDSDGNILPEPREFPAHSYPLQNLGTFVLWFGWYGFNPGSTLGISGGQNFTAAVSAVTTSMAGAGSGLSAMLLETYLTHKRSGELSLNISNVMNGSLAGMVAINASCAVVKPWIALIIGIIAGFNYVGVESLLLKFRIDDVCNCIPVHLANGLWGLIAAALVTEPTLAAAAGYSPDAVGLFYGGGFTLLLVHICAILFIVTWTTCTMGPFFYILHVTNHFRVPQLEEDIGMDIIHHKGSGYDHSRQDGRRESEIAQLHESLREFNQSRRDLWR